MLFSEISKLSGTGELDAIADSVEQSHPIFLLQLLYVLALHILHRQSLVSDIEFLEFSCSLEEMLGFIF
jgi:hypothetical protein